MSWNGCYTLDLYCDRVGENLPGDSTDGRHTWNEFPHEYVDEHGSACRAKARRDGWIIKNNGTAICPKCSGKDRAAKTASHNTNGETNG